MHYRYTLAVIFVYRVDVCPNWERNVGYTGMSSEACLSKKKRRAASNEHNPYYAA